MQAIINRVRHFAKDESGATAVEYGLMVALIAGAIVVTVDTLGGSLDTLFSRINGKITANTPAQ